ncbi:hypothetical protein PFICI_14693 [Pestalotiopsis fici W106-1]|uniref:Zn(2)-C6 fungal-type domain-containing protein n=1 Tax=Pestalotiopsis fici (strain W106-1 / CGMCC3.15140) TaxID=1229662 RepID=W3WKT8_PESFW|nr:uncharacterized protein PFICI_14693 [Pestalotiopsis fici W106-1]ETS73747.1 hypothetical protein PFICI_14693 [Pestalotiopsis fici W106-1]
MSAPYGQACAGCVKAKCKCVSRGAGNCERCHRRGMECRQTDGIRKRSSRKQPDINHRTSQLEERLNDLVEILRLQQVPGPRPQVPAQETDSQTTVSPSSGNHAASGAYLTPPTAIASLGSQAAIEASPNPAKAFEDDLTPFEAEGILQRFRTGYLTMFPCVYIRSDTTAQQLQQYRPFLWLNIRTVCEKSAPKMHAMGDHIRELLGRKVLVELERDVDVLLGLMVYLGWATHQTRGKGFQARYANLANSLIQDLRLDQPFNPNAGGNCWFPQSKMPTTSPEHTHEQRRAVIGTFVLSSSISSFLKIDVTRWNSHMEESLEKLAADPECPGDELLVAMARAKVIVNDVGRLTWRRTGNDLSTSPSVYVKPLKDRVLAIRRSLKPELVENRALQSHLYNAEVLIGEMAIFHSATTITPSYNCPFPSALPLPATQSSSQAAGTSSSSSSSSPQPPPGLRPIDMPRLETLHECLHSIKQCITTIQSFEPAAWPTFPFAVMGHMSHSLQMLYRLSALDSEPDWDAAAVRRDFDVIAVIHRVADTMSRVADAAGLTGDPELGPYGDMFSKGVGTLRATAAIWGSALPPLEDPAATSSSSVSSAAAAAAGPFDAASDTAGLDTMAMILDFQNDPWLTELYNSWEGI